MPKGKPEETVLEDYRTTHLPYELWMLEETYERLKDAPSGVCTNALIESFCIHARNLIEFYRGSDKNDYVKAKHFTRDGTYKPKYVGDPAGEVGRTVYAKLNQQVAHLAKDRTSEVGKKIGSEDRKNIFEALRKEEATFRLQMERPLRSAKISVGSERSATNVITTTSVSASGKKHCD